MIHQRNGVCIFSTLCSEEGNAVNITHIYCNLIKRMRRMQAGLKANLILNQKCHILEEIILFQRHLHVAPLYPVKLRKA